MECPMCCIFIFVIFILIYYYDKSKDNLSMYSEEYPWRYYYNPENANADYKEITFINLYPGQTMNVTIIFDDFINKIVTLNPNEKSGIMFVPIPCKIEITSGTINHEIYIPYYELKFNRIILNECGDLIIDQSIWR